MRHKMNLFVKVFAVGMMRRVLAYMTRHEVQLKNTIVEQLRKRTTYVRATEVMSILGVTRNTLCDWINAGALPAYRLGKNNIFDPAELAAFLETRRTGV
jgi:excisionase family DNA binding protein